MSNENFITQEVMQEGIDISARGNALHELSEIAVEQAGKRDGNDVVPVIGEAGMIGAIRGIQTNTGTMTGEEFYDILKGAGNILGLDVEEIRSHRYWIDMSVGAINTAKLKTIGDATELLGSVLHEMWRYKSFSDGEGGFNPRVKCLVEREGKEKWVNVGDLKEGETPIFSQDIANTSFSELHPHWQKDNHDAAQTVVEIIVNRYGKIDLSDSEMYELIGHEIHQAWLSRAGWIEPGLEKSFSELSEEQREKDINQMRIALKVFGLDTIEHEEEDEFDIEARELIDDEIFTARLESFILGLSARGIVLDWLTTELDAFSIELLSGQTEFEDIALQARIVGDSLSWIDQVLSDKDFVPDSSNEIYDLYRDEALQRIGYMLEKQEEEVGIVLLDTIESIIGSDYAHLPSSREERLELLSMHGSIKDLEYDALDAFQEIRAGLLFDLQGKLESTGSKITGEILSKTIWRLLQHASANELEALTYEDFNSSKLNANLPISFEDFNEIKNAVKTAYDSGFDSAD